MCAALKALYRRAEHMIIIRPVWTNTRLLHMELKYVTQVLFFPLFFHLHPHTHAHTHIPRSGHSLCDQVTHRWLWGAPSCRCGRCRTVAPASGPCTRTSPGPRSALGRSAGRPSHAERLYLHMKGNRKQWHRDQPLQNIYIFSVFLLFKTDALFSAMVGSSMGTHTL